jgi:hypothetical protein
MKKAYAVLFGMFIFVACSEDNPINIPEGTDSSSSEETIYSSDKATSSSSGETDSDKRIISWTQTREYAFLDTIHLRYYHLDHDCIYKESSNSFSWESDKYLGIVDIDTLYTNTNYGHSSFGYKLSNDTLYECDYIADECNDVSKMKAASVYTGSSKSLLGTWNYVGRIYDGIFFVEEDFANVEMTIAPTGTTEKITYVHDPAPLYYTNNFCTIVYDLFEEADELENACFDYFGAIKKHNGKYERYIKGTNTYESIPDTVKLGDDYWVTATSSNEIVLFVNGINLNVKYNQDMLEDPITLKRDLTVSNGQKTCEYHSTQISQITKEICEAATYDPSKVTSDYSNITGKEEKMLDSYLNNNSEFRQCLKQLSKTE